MVVMTFLPPSSTKPATSQASLKATKPSIATSKPSTAPAISSPTASKPPSQTIT
ncbi:MAG: hypothetical protein ACFCU8_07560 [Thermosynechococcaceae cyanobacterium]